MYRAKQDGPVVLVGFDFCCIFFTIHLSALKEILLT